MTFESNYLSKIWFQFSDVNLHPYISGDGIYANFEIQKIVVDKVYIYIYTRCRLNTSQLDDPRVESSAHVSTGMKVDPCQVPFIGFT